MPRDENRLRVNYYLAWARTYLKRGGALENSARGVWSLTDKGMSLTTYEDARAIYDHVVMEERQRARLKRLSAKHNNAAAPDTQQTTDEGEQLDTDAGPEGEEDWKSALLAVVGRMTPDAFERLSQRLLREAGFTKVETRQIG